MPLLVLVLALSALLRFAVACRAVVRLGEDNPLRWVRWTRPQDAFHRLKSKRKLLRAGNQIGKTWAALAEVIWRCTGSHPHFKTPPPPIEAWVVCHSWSQSVAIMSKFRLLCPGEIIDERQTSAFSIKNGYGKDNPCVVFRCGSVVRFKTTGQGGISLSSATLDLVLIDEPTTPEIYMNLDRRLTRTGGTLLMSLTPVNMPCGWIEEMVEEGVLDEVHATLTAANLTPVALPGDPHSTRVLRTKDGTPMDEQWIAEQRRITASAFAPVVLDGEWNIRPEGVFFENFDARTHVSATARFDPRRGKIRWCLGIDYASAAREHGQVAVLCQVQQVTDEKGRKLEAVIVRDEVVAAGIITNAQFARLVLDMLDRQGVQWRELDTAFGDNPVVSRWVRKSNLETMRAIEKLLGMRSNALQPRIISAKEGTRASGMVDTGCRYIYALIAEGRFLVHPACTGLIEAMQVWDYDFRHPAKDRIDGVRYALKGFIFPRGGRSNTVLRTG